GLLQRLVGAGAQVVGANLLVVLRHLLRLLLERVSKVAGRLPQPLPHLLPVPVADGASLLRELLLLLGGGLHRLAAFPVALDNPREGLPSRAFPRLPRLPADPSSRFCSSLICAWSCCSRARASSVLPSLRSLSMSSSPPCMSCCRASSCIASRLKCSSRMLFC